LETDTTLSDEVSVRFNYTYTDAEMVSGGFKGKEVPFLAKDTANFNILFSPIGTIVFSFESQYTGQRYKANDEANSEQRLPHLVLFNFGITHDYHALSLGARIKNMTNEKYAGYHGVFGQYPQPERNYEASITYKF
jgi:iron complex outermembrane recepter protein